MANMVARLYGGFRGVDFRGEEIDLARSPDSVNMWRDYKETQSIRTRPGLELRKWFDSPVYGIFFFNSELLVHSGNALYRVVGSDAFLLYSNLAASRSDSFAWGDKWYFKDGKSYLVYDGSEVKPVEGYIPTTTIARKPSGGGTPLEDVNMLSRFRKNSFLADGKSVDFYLDTMSIDADFNPVVMVNDEVIASDKYTVDHAAGKITFKTAPAVPLTDGRDNVLIEFAKTVPEYREAVERCTLLQVFDNRVFFAGDPEHPNVVRHCSLDDPSYVSDTDYYNEGLDAAAIRGMVAGNNALWIFREPSSANTTVFYHTPTIDDEFGKIYPSTHSSITTGCIGAAINFGDDIVFFSDRGMEGISGDITTEQVIAHRSTLVDRKLTAEDAYKDMILAEWEGYLLVFIGERVYLADSRAMFANGSHYEYEWFYWDLGERVTCVAVHDGVLYLGMEGGVWTLTNGEVAIKSWWVTPKDRFGQPHKLKTSNKRGCVAEATGDISVFAKVEDTDFELIGEYRGVLDYFVSRIKRKKFKDIQLKFYSASRFSLETVTLECFIGGYIKR